MEQGPEMGVYREGVKDQANLVAKEQVLFLSVSYLLAVWNCSLGCQGGSGAHFGSLGENC